MNYQVAICDDSPADAQYVSALVREWAGRCGAAVHVELFASAEAFLFRYAEHKEFDLLLLDIEMGVMDGVTLAKTLRRENETLQIIFITGYSDYISEGYEVAALHYLVKPVGKEKLFQVLDRAEDRLRKNERVLTLELSGETVRIPLYQIRYVDVCHNYITVHAREAFTVKMSLSQLAKLLVERFFKVGRSAVVNLTCIRKVTKTDIFLEDGATVPLPRGAYEKVNRAIIQMG